MTLPISPKSSAEALAIAPAGGDAKGAKAAEKPGENGFASLFSKLSSKSGKAAGSTAADTALPVAAAKTGKILPVNEQALADGAKKEASGSDDTDGSDSAAPTVAPAPNPAGIVIPLALPAIVKAAAGPLAQAKPAKAADPAKPAVPTALAAMAASGKPDTGRMPAASANTAGAAMAKIAAGTGGKLARPEPDAGSLAATAETAQPQTAQPQTAKPQAAELQAAQPGTPKPQTASARPAGFTLNIAPADKPAGRNSADGGAGDKASGNAESGANKLLSGARFIATDQPARLFEPGAPQHLAVRPMTAAASQPAATPATAQTAMSAEGIAHFVDRIALARSFDMAQPASLIVKHQDFGPLTVTFDHSQSGLDVQVAAQDAETQRALASAMAHDRNLVRPADGHSSVQASHSASAGGERNAASSGQTFASNGGGQPGDRPSGQPSSQSSDQTFGRSAPQNRRTAGRGQTGSASHAAGDDALYA